MSPQENPPQLPPVTQALVSQFSRIAYRVEERHPQDHAVVQMVKSLDLMVPATALGFAITLTYMTEAPIHGGIKLVSKMIKSLKKEELSAIQESVKEETAYEAGLRTLERWREEYLEQEASPLIDLVPQKMQGRMDNLVRVFMGSVKGDPEYGLFYHQNVQGVLRILGLVGGSLYTTSRKWPEWRHKWPSEGMGVRGKAYGVMDQCDGALRNLALFGQDELLGQTEKTAQDVSREVFMAMIMAAGYAVECNDEEFGNLLGHVPQIIELRREHQSFYNNEAAAAALMEVLGS